MSDPSFGCDVRSALQTIARDYRELASELYRYDPIAILNESLREQFPGSHPKTIFPFPQGGPPCGMSAKLAIYALTDASLKKESAGRLPFEKLETAVERGDLVRVCLVPACGFDGPPAHVVVCLKVKRDEKCSEYLVVDSYAGRKNFEIRRLSREEWNAWRGDVEALCTGNPDEEMWRRIANLREPVYIWHAYFAVVDIFRLDPEKARRKLELLREGKAHELLGFQTMRTMF